MKKLISFLRYEWDKLASSIHFLWIMPGIICIVLLFILSSSNAFGQNSKYWPEEVKTFASFMLDELSECTSGAIIEGITYGDDYVAGIWEVGSYYDQELFRMKISSFINEYSDLNRLISWRKNYDDENDVYYNMMFSWDDFPQHAVSVSYYPNYQRAIIIIFKSSTLEGKYSGCESHKRASLPPEFEG